MRNHATRIRTAALLFVLSAVLGAMFLAGAAPAAVDATPAPDAPVEKKREDRHPMPADWTAPDQMEAEEQAMIDAPFVKDVLMEDNTRRQQRLRALGIGIKDIKSSYMWLDSSKVDAYENQYEPVRFMHTKHASALDGNCALCHHYRPEDPEAPEIVACRACHQEPFKAEAPERVGLKAAYHMQCVQCHENMKQGPVNCDSCHEGKHTDHKELVKLPEDPTPEQVTKECLTCHEASGQEMLKSAHWLWRGPSPYTLDQQKEVMSGKATNALNNF